LPAFFFVSSNKSCSLFQDNSSNSFDLDENTRVIASNKTEEFFRELLLTYRLFFGQDTRSWKAFHKELRNLNAEWDCSAEQPDSECDPLLPQLCGKNWRTSRGLYEELDYEKDDEISSYYSVTDFPFFGKRILELQQFSQGRQAHNWSLIWLDRRNADKWWTFWAVMFFGGFTVIVGLLQLAFQIAQTFRS
jgi:hypothetical protein